MKAWQLDQLGGELSLVEKSLPEPRPGGVVVKMLTSSLMSYMREYVDGKLPVYHAPPRPFIPGGNGIGIVHAVGCDVWHLKPGQRVAISSHFVANENVRDPARMLIGITAAGKASFRMQEDWPDGTLAEYALLPASTLTPVDELAGIDSTRLATLARYVVPFGGLLRGRLAAGETVVVSGATGAYGMAAARLAIAMGASRVAAIGRNTNMLDRLVRGAPGRIVSVHATGDVVTDAAALRDAVGGATDLAFDMVGNATDPNMTLAALRSLGFGGRLVLMGSMSAPLPLPYTDVMLNGWEIIGQFMYPRDAWQRLLPLIASGQLSVDEINAVTYPFAAIPDAIDAAADALSCDCVVIDHEA